MIRSETTMGAVCDAVMAGATMTDAAHSIGARSVGALDTWRVKSQEAEQQGDTSSPFFFAWPSDAEPDFFHKLVDRARARRGELLSTPLLRGAFQIIDGRIQFEHDDFTGEILLDDNGVPVARGVVHPVEPPTNKGQHRPDPAKVREAMSPRRPLAPSSTGNKPSIPAPIFTGNALSDYLKGTGTISKEPSPMREELEAKLAEARANPNRASARHRPIAVLGRREDGPQERVSHPNDMTGIPTQMADAPRREAPQPKPAAVDYSRRAPPVRLDAPGRG